MGRKSTYNQTIADELLKRLSNGEPLASICRDERMPAAATVSDWKRSHPEFAVSFACAREDGFDRIASDCLDIADDTSRDTITTDDGDRADTEWISRSKLRIETRLKLLAVWDYKRYGAKQSIDVSGDITIMSDEQRRARLAELQAKLSTGLKLAESQSIEQEMPEIRALDPDSVG